MSKIPLLEYLFNASIVSSVQDITVVITSLLDNQSIISDSDITCSADSSPPSYPPVNTRLFIQSNQMS